MAGKRKAFLVGDDYPGGPQLSGCRNDKRHQQQYLEQLGFDEIVGLENEQCTKEAIEDGLAELVGSLTGADLGVFYNSGHGTEGSISLTPGAPAVKHEGIVPFDFRRNGIIWDQHLRNTLSLVDDDARMVVILDTCFSGGMYRFAPPISDHYRAVRFLPPDEWLRPVDIQAELDRLDPDVRAVFNPGDKAEAAKQLVLDQIAAVADQKVVKAYPVLLLAASQAGQVAWCAEMPSPLDPNSTGGVAQGAFTYALLEVLQGRGRNRRTQRQPTDYLQAMYGARDLHGVVTVRGNRPGLLPSADLADQDPTLHGSPGRVRWPVFQA